MDPVAIIAQFYRRGGRSYEILCRHGEVVAEKALMAADAVSGQIPDREFIYQAAMLHDVGIFMTDCPGLGCHGFHPYICHGILGARLLFEAGLSRHGLVCERHVGVGITAEDVRRQGLPLPERDMTPQSLEEIIVCYADKFFSKNGKAQEPLSMEEILHGLGRYGPDKTERFCRWAARFGPEGSLSGSGRPSRSASGRKTCEQ
jgi:uncharacterized protein